MTDQSTAGFGLAVVRLVRSSVSQRPATGSYFDDPRRSHGDTIEAELALTD